MIRRVAAGYSFSQKMTSDGIIKKKVDATIDFLWENISAFYFKLNHSEARSS
jgi:hypothetical protein